MPKTIIAANWKMNKTSSQAQEFITQLQKELESPDESDKEVIICPNDTLLHLFKDSGLNYGAQNMYSEEEGAFTGETSPLMLKELGCQYVIIGHSERRQYFGETNQSVNKKLKLALKHGLKPIFCVGETLEQREAGKTQQVVETQIKEGLYNLQATSYNLVIAYEPVWAIGTGKTAAPEQAQEVHAQIRALATSETSILYGGSVKPANISQLMAQKDINGALVGGASLDVESFIQIINY